jgi:hypothetical protein
MTSKKQNSLSSGSFWLQRRVEWQADFDCVKNSFEMLYLKIIQRLIVKAVGTLYNVGTKSVLFHMLRTHLPAHRKVTIKSDGL